MPLSSHQDRRQAKDTPLHTLTELAIYVSCIIAVAVLDFYIFQHNADIVRLILVWILNLAILLVYGTNHETRTGDTGTPAPARCDECHASTGEAQEGTKCGRAHLPIYGRCLSFTLVAVSVGLGAFSLSFGSTIEARLREANERGF